MLSPDMDIRVDLNSDSFDLADKDVVAERLRAETDLRIESDVAAYAGVAGGPAPPDVAIYILYTLFPLADIYANVLASALYDAVKTAFAREGKPESQATFSIVKLDEDGNFLGQVRGETSDPEVIKGLVRRLGQEGDSETE